MALCENAGIFLTWEEKFTQFELGCCCWQPTSWVCLPPTSPSNSRKCENIIPFHLIFHPIYHSFLIIFLFFPHKGNASQPQSLWRSWKWPAPTGSSSCPTLWRLIICFSVFLSTLIIMYDDIVVQSQTNELITRDTHRELVLETHSNAVGKICFSQSIAIYFQSKRLDCWADILCWKRWGSILGFQKLKFFSSSFSLNDGAARISWGFVF